MKRTELRWYGCVRGMLEERIVKDCSTAMGDEKRERENKPDQQEEESGWNEH